MECEERELYARYALALGIMFILLLAGAKVESLVAFAAGILFPTEAATKQVTKVVTPAVLALACILHLRV